jgi:hypothetical protein
VGKLCHYTGNALGLHPIWERQILQGKLISGSRGFLQWICVNERGSGCIACSVPRRHQARRTSSHWPCHGSVLWSMHILCVVGWFAIIHVVAWNSALIGNMWSHPSGSTSKCSAHIKLLEPCAWLEIWYSTSLEETIRNGWDKIWLSRLTWHRCTPLARTPQHDSSSLAKVFAPKTPFCMS